MSKILSHENSLSVERFDPAEVNQLNTFYEKIFSRSRTAEQWEWEYLRNPHGKSLSWVLKTREDSIAGHFSLLPIRMANSEISLLTGKGEGIMLDPDFRGKGIYPEFVRECLSDVNMEPFQAIWVTFSPAERSLLQAGFHSVCPLIEYQYPPGWRDFLPGVPNCFPRGRGLMARLLWLQNFLLTRSHRPVTLTPISLSEFASTASEWRKAQKTFSVQRDEAYLTWRFLENPYSPRARFCRLSVGDDSVGACIVLDRDTECHLEDFIIDPDRLHSLTYRRVKTDRSGIPIRYRHFENSGLFAHHPRHSCGSLLVQSLDGESRWQKPECWNFSGLFSEGVEP